MTIQINDKAIADLHVHTTLSDGIMSPTAIMRAVKKRSKIEFLSFTDHYTTRAFDNAQAIKEWYDIKVLPGIEISAKDYKYLHILGLGMSDRTDIENSMARFSNNKDIQLMRIFANLKEMGVELNDKFINKIKSSPKISLEQIAIGIIKQGYAKNIKDAKKKYFYNNHKTEGKMQELRAKEIIGLINQAGGVACLAHPNTVRHRENRRMLDENEWEQLIETLKHYGLKAIECIPPIYCPTNSRKFFEAQARNFNLLRTGGSDYHGDRDLREEIGNPRICQKDIDNLLYAIQTSNNKAARLKSAKAKDIAMQPELV